jgi:di/tripeptidase
MEVKNLEPQELWNNFANLNAVPRASKKEEKVIEFMVNYGNSLGLETIQDKNRQCRDQESSYCRYGKQTDGDHAITPGYGSSEKR